MRSSAKLFNFLLPHRSGGSLSQDKRYDRGDHPGTHHNHDEQAELDFGFLFPFLFAEMMLTPALFASPGNWSYTRSMIGDMVPVFI
jgi:hypothetical protein